MNTRWVKMPEASSVGFILEQLLGVPIACESTPPADFDNPLDLAVAEYRDSQDEILGVWLCDRAFSCKLGGALSMMTPETINEALAAPTAPDEIREDVYEILNIGARLFIELLGHHVKLTQVHWDLSTVPAELRSLVAEPGGRLDLTHEIEGYGSARSVMIGGAPTSAPEEVLAGTEAP